MRRRAVIAEPTDLLIAGCFNGLFRRRRNVQLIGGAEEPLYLPAVRTDPATIRYTRDYARSALHEIAHWCIAGEDRRDLPDYGYWYSPPPRDARQQRAFCAAEVAVQSLEKLFASACGVGFAVSIDNPGESAALEEQFADTVARRVEGLSEHDLSARARCMLEGLRRLAARHSCTRNRD